MELPTEVTIAGRKYKVTKCKGYGGRFHCGDRVIHIGEENSKESLLVFLHEAFEAILVERLHRYTMYSDATNEKMLFSFNHSEFESLIADFAVALKDLLKPVYKRLL